MAAPRRYAGPTDPTLHQQWRSERRSATRAHHPDRGGDPSRLQDELARIDAAYRSPEPPVAPVRLSPPTRWQPVARALRRAGRSASRTARRVRAGIPPGWPGSRRYLDL